MYYIIYYCILLILYYYTDQITLCSDKTGTLTLNKMAIQDETPVYSRGETQYSVLRYAAMAAKWKGK